MPDPPLCDVIADVLGLDVDDVLTIAGHRPSVVAIPPDDPRRELHALVDRIDWRSDRFEVVRNMLHSSANDRPA